MSEVFALLHFSESVTLLGAGPHARGDLEAALAVAPRLVCADGGADMASGRTPDAVIGDLDSISDVAAWKARLGERLIASADQDTTDLEKCLSMVSAPLFIGVGFAGGRVDHTLAALHALLAEPRPVLLLGEEDVLFVPPPALRLRLTPGDRVSLFPLRPVKGLRSEGLSWPIDGLSMEAGQRIGTSNRASSEMVAFAFDRRGVAAALPRERLDSVLAAVSQWGDWG